MSSTPKEKFDAPSVEREGPFDLAEVLVDELLSVGNVDTHLKSELRAPDVSLYKVFNAFYNQNLTALSLSGGGIRSATFALGVIQSMASHNLLRSVDYLSTVSGGGYIGSWLSNWIRTEQIKAIEQKVCSETAIHYRIKKKALKSEDPTDKKIVAFVSELYPSPPNRAFPADPQISEIVYTRYIKAKEGDSPLDKKITTLIDAAVGDAMFGRTSYATMGVTEVQRQINRDTFATRDNSNPEASPICHLRQYSNFMTPSVGLMSADTWAFFSIYIRNLFLNWTIFIPLMAAILLIPRIILSTTLWYKLHPENWKVLMVVGVIAGSFAISYVVNKLPSKNHDGDKIKFSTDGYVLGLGVVPLTIFAFCLTTICYGIAGTEQLPRFNFWLFDFPFDRFWEIDSNWLNFTCLMGSIYILGYVGYGAWRLLWWLMGRNRMLDSATNVRGILCGFASSIASGALLWIIAAIAFNNKGNIHKAVGNHGPELFVCLAVPVFLFVILFQSALYVGLSSKQATDDDREWFARFGGWVFIVSGAWIGLNATVLLWPFFVKAVFFGGGVFQSFPKWTNSITGFLQAAIPIITILSGVISLAGGFSSKLPLKKDGGNTAVGRVASLAPQIAAVVFTGIIITALAYGSAFIISKFLIWSGPMWMAVPLEGNIAAMSSLDILNNTSVGFLSATGALLVAAGIFMAFRINVNTFSLHGAYRDRLIRAYLGASHVNRKPNPFTAFDERDNRQLHRLKRQKPFHVMNATLNLLDSDNLAWQSRKAACFTMSPLHCGSSILKYRRTNQYSRNDTLGPCKHYRFCNRIDKDPCSKTVVNGAVEGCQFEGKSLRLGTAMAISGAAANPNMGFYSSPAVTFLMSLFNIRLGWWLGNTNWKKDVEKQEDKDIEEKGKKVIKRQIYKRTGPKIAVFPLINETLGRTSEDKRYLNVTDGGHFENLAIYEMVRRRCQFIVVSDGAADENFKFSEISNAIEKCKVDLGVEIKFRGPINIPSRTASKQDRKAGKRYAIADVIYPAAGDTERRKGLLLYLRPTILGDEPINIKHYAEANPKFPHQSTGDQFFDEKQFEAYRELGFLTFEGILADTPITSMGALRKHLNSQSSASPSVVTGPIPLKTTKQPRLLRLQRLGRRLHRRYLSP